MCLEGFKIKMFADDMLVYGNIVMGESYEEGVRKEIWCLVEKWMNMLQINTDKTKCLIVRSIRKELRANVILKCLDGTVIERVEKGNI